MTTILLWALGKSLANVTNYSLKHLDRISCDFLLNSMSQLLNFDLCVKPVERWLQTARVTQSGDAQNGVDFFQWPLSPPQYSRVYVPFSRYHFSSLV